MTLAAIRTRLADSGVPWFVVAVLATLGGAALATRAGLEAPSFTLVVLLAGTLALLVLAGLAAWQLVRRGIGSWLLPLAALNLVLLQPGRAGEARTWRLEWGVMGLLWTCAAVLVFARSLRRADELERRLHLEGTFLGLAAALLAAVAYALFEPRLPALRAQWVAVGLLVAWWAGFLTAARRYRWLA